MRKILIPRERRGEAEPSAWINLLEVATATISSEDPDFTLESALGEMPSHGWKAADPGEQDIRFVFDTPRLVRRIRLCFREEERQRTQEFVLRWLGNNHRTFHEIVRQQYNFSPPRTIEEVEDYNIELSEVMALELAIVPDIAGGDAVASSIRFQVG